MKRLGVAAGLAMWLIAVAGAGRSPAAEAEPRGKPQAQVRGSCILTHPDSGELVRYAARELQKYLRRLCGGEVTAKSAGKLEPPPAGKALFVLGSARQLARTEGIPKQFLEKIATLKAEGFAVSTLKTGQGRVVLIGAGDDGGVLYGVYDVLERLGCCFRTTGDIVPEPQEDRGLPELEYQRNPLLRRRGFLTHPCYPQVGTLSLDDWRAALDQMAKQKLNYLIFYWFSGEPWIRYEYRGEPIALGGTQWSLESGSLLWPFVGHYVSTAEIPIGAEKFRYPRLAPPEFQSFRTQDDLFRAAGEYLRGLIAHAHRRNIEVWLAFDPVTLPENLGRRARQVRVSHVFGSVGTSNDPVLREINQARLASLFKTYPEADGYFLWMPEGFFVDEHPDNLALYERERTRWQGALEVFVQRWKKYGQLDRQRAWTRFLRADVATVEVFKDCLEDKRKINPKARLGIGCFGKAYAFPVMHGLFPEDVPFAVMESSGVWTPGGAPFDLLAKMGGRQRIVIPRIDDDGSVVGLQFNVTLFRRDKVIAAAREYGVDGFAGQHYRFRGAEHNSRYLAEAAWEEDLGAEAFYRRYCQRIFGAQAAEPIARAMLIMEKNDQTLGWRGQRSLPWSAASSESALMRQFYAGQDPKQFRVPASANAQRFAQRRACFEGVLGRIREARHLLEPARPAVEPKGRGEFEYLDSRLKVYEHLAETIVELNTAFSECVAALQPREPDRDKFLKRLDAMKQHADRAWKTSLQAAQEQARLAEHPSELAVLEYLNCGLIKHVRPFHEFVDKLVASYHE